MARMNRMLNGAEPEERDQGVRPVNIAVGTLVARRPSTDPVGQFSRTRLFTLTHSRGKLALRQAKSGADFSDFVGRLNMEDPSRFQGFPANSSGFLDAAAELIEKFLFHAKCASMSLLRTSISSRFRSCIPLSEQHAPPSHRACDAWSLQNALVDFHGLWRLDFSF